MGPYAALLYAALLGIEQPPPAVSPSDAPTDGSDEAVEPEGGAGVSPIELIPRVELRQSFQKLEGGVTVHQTIAEIDIQFLRRVLLRYQVPYGLLETPKGQFSGIGDIPLLTIVTIDASSRTYLGLIAGAVLNTASQPPLGAGKQQLVFGGGAAYKPRRWLIGYAVAQEQLSISGDNQRPDINELSGDLGVIVFGKQYNWLKLDFLPSYDFAGTHAPAFGTAEVGSLLVGRVGLFVRAGTQLYGQSQLGYSLAAGMRYLFKLQAGKPR